MRGNEGSIPDLFPNRLVDIATERVLGSMSVTSPLRPRSSIFYHLMSLEYMIFVALPLLSMIYMYTF